MAQISSGGAYKALLRRREREQAQREQVQRERMEGQRAQAKRIPIERAKQHRSSHPYSMAAKGPAPKKKDGGKTCGFFNGCIAFNMAKTMADILLCRML